MRECFVVHITAYPDDPLVKDHIDNHCQRKAGDKKPAVIEKDLTKNWHNEVLDLVKGVVTTRMLEKDFDQLFGETKGPSMNRGSLFGTGQANIWLMKRFIDNAESNWAFIDDALKSKIRSRLIVKTSSDGRVSIRLV